MSFSELFKGYPFPGALTKFSMPPGPDDWQPKFWSTTGIAGVPSNELTDLNAHFLDDGIQIGDVLYATGSPGQPPLATSVLFVIQNTLLAINDFLEPGATNIVYKVGMKAPHTLQTLANIVLARGLKAATFHWSLVWTQAPFLDFRHDETGDIYVCHNPGAKRLKKLLKREYFDEDGHPRDNPWLTLNPEPDL